MKNILIPAILLCAPTAFAQTDNAPYATVTLADGQTENYDLSDIECIDFVKLPMVETIAGSGAAAITDGVGTAAAVRSPQGIAFAPGGDLWICSQNGHKIQRMTPGYEVSTVAVNGVTLNAPWGCAFDRDGNFIVASKGNNSVFSVAPDGTGTILYSGTDWKGPMGVTTDADGAIYVCCRDSKKVRKIAVNGTITDYDMSDCKQGPCAAAVAADGRIYVVNGADYKVFVFDPDGTRSVLFGTGKKPTADTWSDGLPGNPASATMGQSFGITIAADGTLYINDLLAFVVRSVTPDASGDYTKGTVRTFAGTPFVGGKLDGNGYEASFKALGGIVCDNDKIYVAGNGNNLIRLITK